MINSISGCDVNVCDTYANVTALHVAVNTYTDETFFQQLLGPLLQGGCWLDSRAFTSLETPLYRAIDQNKVGIALVLLQNGASSNVECPYEITMLHKACQRKQYDIIHTLLYSDVDWTRETWLDDDKYTCGINLKLLDGYKENIPMVLHDKLDLFFMIQEMRHNPVSLIRCCRLIVRQALHHQLFLKIKKMNLPKKLEDFLMLRII